VAVVVARSEIDCIPTPSSLSIRCWSTTDINPPTIVTGLSAMNYFGTKFGEQIVPSSQIYLQWTQNPREDKVSQYNVYRGTTPEFPVTPGTTSPRGITPYYLNSFSDYDVNPSTTYYYKVAAVDEAGNIGPLSSEVSATLATPDTTTTSAPTNHAPLADSIDIATNQNTPVKITLSASDTNNDPLTFDLIQFPSHGTLLTSMDAHPPNVEYTPQQNYVGEDSFTFKANDGKADSNIGTVRINVVGATVPADTYDTIITPATQQYSFVRAFQWSTWYHYRFFR
jgi:hypothetical protein